MVNMDKLMLSTAKTSKGTNQNEVNTTNQSLMKNYRQAYNDSDEVVLFFGDGWSYVFKSNYRPYGWYNQFGVFQFETKTVPFVS